MRFTTCTDLVQSTRITVCAYLKWPDREQIRAIGRRDDAQVGEVRLAQDARVPHVHVAELLAFTQLTAKRTLNSPSGKWNRGEEKGDGRFAAYSG
jgi:hypothetical protein